LEVYKAGAGIAVFLIIVSLALPVVYLYFWIVVNGLRVQGQLL
jgi:hypothetical protein